MIHRTTVAFGTIALLCMGITPSASAQSLKDQVIGAYTLQSGAEVHLDGKKVIIWATGSLILAPTGQMSLILVGKDRAKTSTSVRAPVGPAVAYFGTYTVDEAASVINLKVESGVTPAFDGTTRPLKVSVNGDILTATSPETKTPEGTITPVNEWKKAR